MALSRNTVALPAPLAAWQAGGRTVSYRGHAAFVRVDGSSSAEALLLIHGFPTSSWDWHRVLPALAERYRVIAVDLLGFGLSAKPSGYHYSLVDQATLCEALLSAHGVSSYHVLAHDYGDSVAQELLARHGASNGAPRLRSLMFLNGGLFPEMHRPLLVQRLLKSPLGPLVARWMTPARFAASMRRLCGEHTPPDPALLDEMWQLMEHAGGRRAIPRLIGYIDERRRHRDRWVSAMQQTDVPLALVLGASDPVSGAHVADRYRALIPRADVTLLDGIGHYPQIEAPDRVLAAYVDFRERIAPAC